MEDLSKSDQTPTKQPHEKVHFQRWIKVMGIHVLFSAFLTIMNLFGAIAASSATSKLSKVSSDDQITTAHSTLQRVAIGLWIWFALMFMGAFVLVVLTPFVPFLAKFGEYIILLVEIGQTALFLYATIASFSALAVIQASTPYHNGESEALSAASTARGLGYMCLFTFLAGAGYLVYIFIDIFKSGGFRKRLAQHTAAAGHAVQKVGIAFQAPEITVLGSNLQSEARTIDKPKPKPLVQPKQSSTEALSGEI